MKLRHAIMGVALVAIIHGNAKAADLFKPPVEAVQEAVTPAATEYRTGCYVAGSVGMGITSVDAGAINISENGATYGVGGGCDIVTGSLLIGALGNVDFTNQSFAGTSVDPSYQIGVRAGVLISPHVLAYATGGLALTDIDTDYSGYFAGGGLEVLVNRHLFIGGEYTASLYASEGGIEPTGHTVRARAGWRF
jgi:opacity protein-like surface antigen